MLSYVDVHDFGAIGKLLINRGSIGANRTDFTFDDPIQGESALSAWVEGAGISIAGAGEGGQYPHVTRIKTRINAHRYVLNTPALHDALNAPVTNDDSLPIQ